MPAATNTRRGFDGRPWTMLALAVGICCGGTDTAAAHGRSGGVGGGLEPNDMIILSPGVVLGGALPLTEKRHTRLVVGGEVSLLVFGREGLWGGGYVDGLYGMDRRAGRMSAGGVIGYFFGGIDAGYLVDFARGGPHHGFSVRLFAAFGLLTAYARYGYLHESASFLEFGVLIKLPFSLLRRHRGSWKRHVRFFGSY